MNEENIVRELMDEFADRTGLAPKAAAPVRRYLWADAFAVCNYLALYRQSRREEYLHLALNLVDQVHETLGRYRDDDPRSGWISGLGEGEGRLHPTAGGLRIGKKMTERLPQEPFDEGMEWERDGQYYHYLTKWMHALCCVSRGIDNPAYAAWAAELAGRAHEAFCYTDSGGDKRMYWKMSIDLSRPQVASMGHHDPLDGLITCLEIRLESVRSHDGVPWHLEAALNDLTEMSRGINWTTPDPLGLGGLLADSWRLMQLQSVGAQMPLPGLLQNMLNAALVGLSIYTRDNFMHLPADQRLAFRELGLSIGLQALERLEFHIARNPDILKDEPSLISLLDSLKHYLPLLEQIEQFWLDPENRAVSSWNDHVDINTVMLATSLAPEGYLDLQ
jgi:hypothetical protein